MNLAIFKFLLPRRQEKYFLEQSLKSIKKAFFESELRQKFKRILYSFFIIFLFLLLIGGANFCAEAFPFLPFREQKKNNRILVITPSGLKLWLEARFFQPGEIILAQLEGSESIERAWINGHGQKFYFFKKSSATDLKHYSFLGLDGQLQPGEHVLQLFVQREDKSWEVTKFTLNLESREYRERKLRVAPSYLEPPPEMQERIEREAEIMRVVLSMVTPDWLGDGSFIWPHSGPITAYFGDQRLYNNQRSAFHNGVDLAAARGEPIVAANSGQVVLALDFYFSGKIIILDHGLGLFTTYHHLDKILVRRGQKVKKGEIIGLAGSTGLSTGPHLHWSARVGQSRIDPLSLLALTFPGRE